MIEMGRHSAPETLGSSRRPIEVLPAGVTAGDLAEILFCSRLQPSQEVDAASVRAAVGQSLRVHAGRVIDCAADLAEAYGKDPELTCRRMRWCRELVDAVYPHVPAFG